MKNLLKATGLLLFFTIINRGAAEEGMWQPRQISELGEQMTSMGLQLQPESINRLDAFPLNAVVSLGGCSAAFVSPRALVVTNHHCVYGSVQFNSTEENNLLENGFLAQSPEQELPAAPGSRVYVTQTMSEVTDTVLKDVTDRMSGLERYNAIETATKKLIAECESSGIHRCSVPAFHHGMQYVLIKRLEIRDVRLVYAPATSIGKYGGDIDNWQWPRHTGDFGFYRAYVGKDGRPADYSEDNIPYQPESFLSISAKGVDSGSFVMAAGYPGRTNRYRTADEVRNQFEWYYPRAKKLREELISTITANSQAGSQARIAYQSTLASLSNYAKNFQSMINAYRHSDFLKSKQQKEKAFAEWLEADRQRRRNLLPAVEELSALIAKTQEHRERDLVLDYMDYATMPRVAHILYRLALEKQKPDADREPGYQQRDVQRIRQYLQSVSRRYDENVDKAILLYLLQQYLLLPNDQRLITFDHFFSFDKSPTIDSSFKNIVNRMYALTKLNNEKARLQWMDKSPAEFEASDDPMIGFAVATTQTLIELEKIEKDNAGNQNKWRSRYMRALIEYYRSQDKPIYADANGTLRLTYGRTFGNQPRDGLRNLTFTTLEGILEKDTGVEPFNAPQEQLELIQNKHYGDYELASIRSVPVNFLSTLDITGGNSGSAILNGRGQLVGLLFDGVYESIIGDWDFNEEKNRSIAVDVRYMLWVMEYLDNADNLLEEMTIVDRSFSN